jgi:molybdopterin-guanine dinucleotide biosynthesis protein A
MTTSSTSSVAGLLLAGGQGARMGGLDKGLIEWQGRAMAQWVLDALSTVADPVLVSANRSLDAYRRLSPQWVCPDPDDIRGQGPLAGLLTGLRAAERLGVPAVLVCPCDTPGITADVLSRLVQAWNAQPERPVIAECDGRTHPLHGIYPVAVRAALEAWLAAGNRRVMGFAQSVSATVEPCPGAAEAFRNRNRPTDLDET